MCSGGLYMVDVSTPSAPTYAGCFSRDGYTHEPQCTFAATGITVTTSTARFTTNAAHYPSKGVVYHGNDKRYAGREICFACNEDSVTIVDVTSKTRPVQLSRVTYTNTVYTHQGWLTDDHNTFIFGDEFDEETYSSRTRTIVLNLGSNLLKPIIGGVHYSQLKATDHNQYIVGNRVFQSNYQAGLRILRINNAAKANFTEIAYFDTYPSGNSFELNGAWTNYPFFPSGIVVVSGIEQGLFVLKPVLAPQVTACPAALICDATLVLRKCGGMAQKFTMRRSFLGVCFEACVLKSDIVARRRIGWVCGKC
jgi:choice-of-anchor B domain-containing protein